MTRIAIVYDFDGTLSPEPMQEYTVLPELGMQGGAFWERVDAEAAATEGDPMLVYMRLMLEEAAARGVPLTRARLHELGAQVHYFPGVEDWFGRIDAFVAPSGVQLDHYIISAGNREILEGVSIADRFRRIYSSEYHWNDEGRATFPKVLVTDTTKTQFLFRINKGVEALHQSVNQHMADDDRPVPFTNMLYLGDGESDVPGMRVTRSYGGRAIAVHGAGNARKQAACEALVRDGRADLAAEADYREGSRLDTLVRKVLATMLARIELERELD
jgi:hypothetical protein